MEKPGWYWIEQDGQAYPARFDGQRWHAKKHDGPHRVISASEPNCNPECKCTQNPDGTWNVVCP